MPALPAPSLKRPDLLAAPPATLHARLAVADASGLPTFIAVTHSLRIDRTAVEAALTTSWPNGLLEGHVYRVTRVNRHGDCRAPRDLLWAHPRGLIHPPTPPEPHNRFAREQRQIPFAAITLRDPPARFASSTDTVPEPMTEAIDRPLTQSDVEQQVIVLGAARVPMERTQVASAGDDAALALAAVGTGAGRWSVWTVGPRAVPRWASGRPTAGGSSVLE